MPKKQFIFLNIILVIVIGTSFFYWRAKWKTNFISRQENLVQQNLQNLNTEKPTEDVYSVPIAVVVENFPDARPQSGLLQADVVYETLAEGGITRFLAVFKSEKADSIGPIRSARTYFADIANELGALFAHVGGNSDVLQNLKEKKYPNLINIDQFFWDKYFKRLSTHKMPHNVFSSTQVLNSFLADLTLKIKQPGNLPVKDEFVSNTDAKKISINFSQKEYLVEYNYNLSTKKYIRTLAGKLHKDAQTGKALEVSNIIVQYVKTWPVKSDTPFSISMDLESGGKAGVFSQGKVLEGTWKKTDRTRYFDAQNKEISIVPGKVWVELVPEERLGFVTWQ